jgi:hypothetical protein
MIMMANTAWPLKVGRKVAAHTKVSCKISLPTYSDITWGFVQTSKKIEGEWRYSVAFPPEPQQRKAWTLVSGIKPFQLRPIGVGLPETVSSVPSIAQVADPSWTGPVPPRAVSDQVPCPRRSMRSNAVTTIGLGSGSEAIENKSNQPSAFMSVVRSAGATDYTGSGLISSGADDGLIIQRQTPVKSRCKHITLALKVAQKPISKRDCTTRCPHNRRKTLCIECKGGSICKHGKQKSWCKVCGGNALCVHGKQKSRCALCGGKGLCMHSRVRGKCKECSSCSRQ